MSRRQYTTLVLSVSVPVPAGHTQASVIDRMRSVAAETFGPSSLVVLARRETVYLTPRELSPNKARTK